MSANVYETRKLVDEYLVFHYGRPEEVLPWKQGPRDALDFPVRCVTETLEAAERVGKRALDVGCAVGRSSFELARGFKEVIGIDSSKAFIEAAKAMRDHGQLEYYRTVSGAIRSRTSAIVPSGVEASRVSFEVGDACKLREDLGTFDVVLAANLIDRLPRPRAFLEQAPRLLKKKGLLVLTSPYTWLEEFTPQKHWIGGTEETGETSRALEDELAEDFELVRRRDLPFLIREHARKYQWSIAEATVWRRC